MKTHSFLANGVLIVEAKNTVVAKWVVMGPIRLVVVNGVKNRRRGRS